MTLTYILREIRDELHRQGIDVTIAQTHDLYATETELHDYIRQCYMDTGAREFALTILARNVVGRDWPCGADNDHTFLDDLKIALTKRGIAHRLT